jgi:hypothetical protein
VRYAARAQPLDWLSDRHDQSAVQQAATEQALALALVLELARPQGRLGLSGADGVAVSGSWATVTTGTEGSVADCWHRGNPDRLSTAAPAGRRLVCG